MGNRLCVCVLYVWEQVSDIENTYKKLHKIRYKNVWEGFWYKHCHPRIVFKIGIPWNSEIKTKIFSQTRPKIVIAQNLWIHISHS